MKWLKLLLDINQSPLLSKSFLISCTTKMASTLPLTARFVSRFGYIVAQYTTLVSLLEWSRRCKPCCFGSWLWRRKGQKILGCQKLMVWYLGTSRIFQNRKRCQHVWPCSMHIICSYSTWLSIINFPKVGIPGPMPHFPSRRGSGSPGYGPFRLLTLTKLLSLTFK